MATEIISFELEKDLIQRLGIAIALAYEGEYRAYLEANGLDGSEGSGDIGKLLFEFLGEKTRNYWKEILVGHETQVAADQAAGTARASAQAVDIPDPSVSHH